VFGDNAIDVSDVGALAGYAGKRVILGIRPEDLEDAAFAGRTGATISAMVDIRENLGSEVFIHFSVGGAPVRGMADACLPAIGVEVSAEGVGRHYGSRKEGGLLDGWLIHDTDSADVPGVTVRAVPLLMRDDAATAAMVREALDLAR